MQKEITLNAYAMPELPARTAVQVLTLAADYAEHHGILHAGWAERGDEEHPCCCVVGVLRLAGGANPRPDGNAPPKCVTEAIRILERVTHGERGKLAEQLHGAGRLDVTQWSDHHADVSETWCALEQRWHRTPFSEDMHTDRSHIVATLRRAAKVAEA